MSKLDRKLQREILETLESKYPESVRIYYGDDPATAHLVKYNLAYLIEHGLCAAETYRPQLEELSIKNPRITAKGIDFLEGNLGIEA